MGKGKALIRIILPGKKKARVPGVHQGGVLVRRKTIIKNIDDI
jgi:hypothetical protein